MKLSDDLLTAYADGELDADARRTVEDAMRDDPQIAQRIARHTALRDELRAAFSGVLDEPPPDRLLDAANAAPASGGVTDLTAARHARQRIETPRRWAWPEWAAIAASVTLGVFIGRIVLEPPVSNVVAMSDGRIVAAGALDRALTKQASGEDASGIAVLATFRSTSGEYCRAFTADDAAAVAGLACRDGAHWRVHTLSQRAHEGATGDYRMAATTLPPAVLQAIDATIEGDAFDSAQEAAARARGFRD